jgi:hypothetical protein
MCNCPAFHDAGSAASKQKYREQHWRITQYKCNHSAFNGYHYTPSDYSAIICLKCRQRWRTTAAYVGGLSGVTDKDLGITRG